MTKNLKSKSAAPAGLVGAEECLKRIFPDESTRPSLRWFRSLQAKRLVPFRKISRLVFFDEDEVRNAIDRNFRVNAIGE
jgi:hypothetical protein